MEYAIIYGAGTVSELKNGITLFHYPTYKKAVAELNEYRRLSKKHGEPVPEESENWFSVFRNGLLNTYKILLSERQSRQGKPRKSA